MKITIQDARTSVTLQQRDFRVTISGARGPAGPQGDPGEGGEWGTIVGDITEQTDLYNALQAKVPYTGATQDVNLGEYGAQLGNLEFDTTPTNVPTASGSVYWNDTDGTLNLVLKGGQTISRIGETQHIRALNNTGAQIARGKVVYVVGAQGQRLTIALADADTEILSKDTIGFTAEAIADGAEGFVIVQGVINNVSTTGMTDGATVYLSQTAGGYTTTAPTDPAHLVVLGFIVNGGSGGAGSIYVKVDNGYELEELHGVADAAKVTPVGADALLLRDSEDNNLWKRLTWTNALAGVKSHIDTFKSVAGGYASLDGSGKVPASELPSYVDDVVEVANYAALPVTGETGKIYVTLDDNKCYRWSGSIYVEISAGGAGITLTTTGTSGAATLVGSTLNIPQYQGVLTNPVTGTGTAGQVAYFNGTSAVTGSNNLFWDAANGRLGIGTASPTNILDIRGISPTLRIAPTSNQSQIVTFSMAETSGLIRGGMITNIPTGEVGVGALGSGGYFLTLYSNASERARIDTSGNFIIGTTSASARLHVRGSGTTSATTALLVQNSTPSELFKVLDNGAWNFNGDGVIKGSGNTSGTTALTVQNSDSNNLITFRNDGTLRFGTQTILLSSTGNGSSTSLFGRGLLLQTAIGTASGVGEFTIVGSINSTSLNTWTFKSSTNFIPTSGTATYNGIELAQTINQTGGANGITRGLYVNPTLTAAADWRSVETSNNTGYAIYTAGTANSYFGGNVGIGTASPSSKLHIVDTLTTTADLYTPINIAGTITSRNTAGDTIYGLRSNQNLVATASNQKIIGADLNFGTTFFNFTTEFIGLKISGFANTQDNSTAFWAVQKSTAGDNGIVIQPTNNRWVIGRSTGQTTTISGARVIYATNGIYVSNDTNTPSSMLHVRGSGTTSATTALLVQNSTPTANFTIRDDGGYAFRGGTVGLAQTGYTTFTNLTTDRTCDANATTVEELADILGTLIEDLKTKGIIAA